MLAEKVLVDCHYLVLGQLTMITRIARADNPPRHHLSLSASNYRAGMFSLMKIVSSGQSDIQMKPNGNLICLIVPSRDQRGETPLSPGELCIPDWCWGPELTMAANQDPILTVTVGDWSFQDCPRLP